MADEDGAAVEALSPTIIAFRHGQMAFRRGEPAPARPDDDDPCTSPDAIRYLGWMTGRWEELQKRDRTMDILGIKVD